MNVEKRGASDRGAPPGPLAGEAAADLLDQCIHCGLCLPACPTYAVFRHEMDGPRGRIALMRAVAEGRVEVEGAFTRHIDLCVGCLACETACPSGVRYGELLERAKESAETTRKRGPIARLARWILLRQLLPYRARLRLVATLVSLARVTGLLALGRSRLAPRSLRRLAELAPRRRPGTRLPRAEPEPEPAGRRPRVALFAGCVQEAFFGDLNRATERLLERAGYTVVRPPGQTCCGALALHAGAREIAQWLARRNLDAFATETASPDAFAAVVTNAGGCGAMLRTYGRLFAAGSDSERRAEELAARTRDVSELLVDAPRGLPRGRFPHRVAYADSCHLRNGQGVVEAPRQLLAGLGGIELSELDHPDRCCGSGGAYNVVEPGAADEILDLKMAEIRASRAAVVVSSNPGCQLQLAMGARRAGLDVEVLHLVEVLERATAGGEREAG